MMDISLFFGPISSCQCQLFLLHTSRVVVCPGSRGRNNGCLTVPGVRYHFVRKPGERHQRPV